MADKRVAYIGCKDKRGLETFLAYGERVVFKANSSMSQTPNTLSIQMYGVSEYDSGKVIGKAHTVALYAGVEGSEGAIGVGQVVSAKSVLTQNGRVLDITAVDGDDFYAMPVNRAVRGDTSLNELVIELVAATGGSVGIGQISPMAGTVVLPRGVAVIGSPLQMIRNVAKQINAAFYVNQGLVYIVRPEEMIGSQFQMAEQDILSEIAYDGYLATFAHTINAAVRIGGVVILPQSAGYVASVYRVQRIMVEGDTKGPVWKMLVEGAEQTDEGFAQSAATSNVWR